jgi:hypothetical protein
VSRLLGISAILASLGLEVKNWSLAIAIALGAAEGYLVTLL